MKTQLWILLYLLSVWPLAVGPDLSERPLTDTPAWPQVVKVS